jgi:phosphoglycerol transferase MdoB-like AlkP superfamily enzyme
MRKFQHFNYLSILLGRVFTLYIVAVVLMSFLRLYLLLSHGSLSSFAIDDLFWTFLLGFRLDCSVLAYIFAPAVVISLIAWPLQLNFIRSFLYPLFRFYFTIIFILLAVFYLADYTYFSYFGEHSTLMIFGVFDDDTQALIKTALSNYDLPRVSLVAVIVLVVLYYFIAIVIQRDKNFAVNELQERPSIIKQLGFFVFLVVATGLIGRGSVTLFPLAYNTPDPTANHLLNNVAKNPIFALVDSYNAYTKSKSGNYDLIKDMGYAGRIKDAFRIHAQKDDINETNLLENIKYQTAKNTEIEKNPPNVVVVMVESFGMPLLAYQSETFNIMGRIKKHFDEDIVFNNFISASNGTIVSLEPLLLNTVARPKSTSFAQSKYINTSFYQASAKVYKDAGYETSFVYGGDLSWRNIGNFMLKQGFSHVEGRATIAKTLGMDEEKISHDWGVFDEYLYSYVEQKLNNAQKPQFIFVLTTNNHPPYKIPLTYIPKSLQISNDLQDHFTGSANLIRLRLRDYAYAVDMAGKFLDDVKESELAENTVVAITADNNTVEGIMRYDDYYTQAKKIPFYLYLPEYLKPDEEIDMGVASSHKDIFPTLYNLTLSDREFSAMGTNLLEKTKLHCGFNDDGVLVAKDGGFKVGKASSQAQKECERYYKATLAATEYLIKTQK